MSYKKGLTIEIIYRAVSYAIIYVVGTEEWCASTLIHTASLLVVVGAFDIA
jgi:hypothetical protein